MLSYVDEIAWKQKRHVRGTPAGGSDGGGASLACGWFTLWLSGIGMQSSSQDVICASQTLLAYMIIAIQSYRLRGLALARGVLHVFFFCLGTSTVHAEVTLDEVLTHLQNLEKKYSRVQMEGLITRHNNYKRSDEKQQSTFRWLQLGDKAKDERCDANGDTGQLAVFVVNPDKTSFVVLQEDGLAKPRLALAADDPGQSFKRVSESVDSQLEECRAAFWA